MFEALLPAAISAGANILGGIMGRDSASDAAAAQMAWQKKVMKHQIQWRVEDANKAGVHPLFALGAQVSSPGSVSYSDPLPDALGRAGQDISRAMSVGQSQTGKIGQLGEAAANLQLENMQLQNQILASRLRLMNQPGTPPALTAPQGNVMPGQGDSPNLVQVKPGTTETSSPTAPGQAAVVVPDLAFSETATGLAPIPSKSVKEQIEDITLPQLMWGIRNTVLPNFGIGQPPQRDPGPGRQWGWSHIRQEWQSVPIDSRRSYGEGISARRSRGGWW